ncbi:MAG: DMT family transporter [Rhizobiales bacterium]|nr:DMT family transporter [Hyphomicrobiales bacterium]
MSFTTSSLIAKTSLGALGIALFLCGNFLYAVNDVIGKWAVMSFSVGQLLVLRSVGSLAVLGYTLGKQGPARIFKLERIDLQLLRAVLAVLDTALFFAAVAYLPLADVLTFYMAGPIYIAAMSHFFLGEKVGWRRWLAILIGFCGVVIALRPSSAAFSLPSLFALVGSFGFAGMLVLSRRLKGTSDTALVTWQVIASLILGVVLSVTTWKSPSTGELSAMLLMGVISVFAQLMITRALKLAPASVLAPLQYSILLWGILFGYIFFNDVPDTAILIGSAIIVTAGLFIFHRQKVVSDVPRETVPQNLP